MARNIICTVCSKPLGEIRDATLRKGIRYICEPCDIRRIDKLVELRKLKNKPRSMFDSFMDGLKP